MDSILQAPFKPIDFLSRDISVDRRADGTIVLQSNHTLKPYEKGSDGNYFTQAEMKEIIAYAADRGIRVVPEFDIPGHSTSWLVGHPELGSAPGPYSIERTWGIMEPALDPTRGDSLHNP